MGIFGNLQSAYAPLESWFYDRYIASHVATFMEKVYQQIRPYLEALPDDAALLDVGCGGGQLLLRLAEHYPRLRLVGLDLSKEQIDRAMSRAKAKGYETRIRFVQGDAQSLPFESNEFDMLMSMGSIKHWPNDRLGLAECLRVLKSGRWLMIGETHRNCDRNELKKAFHEFGFPPLLRGMLFHVLKRRVFDRSPSAEELKQLFSTMPVAEVEAAPIPTLPIVLLKARKEGALK